MANEILYAGVADLRTTEVLSQEYLLLLQDRKALPMHPALLYAGDLKGSGSDTKKIPHIGMLGYDDLSDLADGASVTPTAHTDASTTITVTRRSKAYSASDLARFTDAHGIIDPQMFAADAAQSAQTKLVQIIAALMGGFSNTVGSTGVNLSVANAMDAGTQLLISNVAGPYLGIIHGRQFGDLRSALATATGSIEHTAAGQSTVEVPVPMGAVRLLGIDWFVSNHIPTANSGADRAGGVFGRGAIAWADMGVDADSMDQISIGGKVLFERDRDGKAGLTDYVTHVYLGASEGIDAAGVSVITDA